MSVRAFLVSVCVVLAGGLSAGETLCRADFRDVAQFRAKGSWQVSADGRSVRTGDAGKGMRSFSLAALPKVDGDYRLSFDVREFGIAPDAKDWHWGFDLRFGGGCRAHFHSRGKGVEFMCHSASGKSLSSRQGGSYVIDRKPDDPAWTRVTLDVRKDSFVLRMDGETCVQQGMGFLPLESVSFYSWRVDVELRDVVLETLPPTEDKPVEAPTFDLASAKPSASAQVAWTNGLGRAKALHLCATGARGVRPFVAYDFDEAPVASLFGGVSCWVRYEPGTPIVTFLGADGKWKGDLTMRGDFPLGFHCALEDGVHSLTFRRRVHREPFRHGEWFHVAFTWDRDGSYRFFVNGLPYATGETHGQKSDELILGNALGETRRIVLESKNPGQELTVQGLRLYRRPILNREVELDYRRVMPIDVVLADSYMPANRPARLKIEVGPGGSFTKCKPVVGERNLSARIGLSATVEKIVPKPTQGRVRQVYSPYGRTDFGRLDVRRTMTLETDEMTLAPGDYRVRIASDRGYARYLFFSVHDEAPRVCPKPDTSRWRKGTLLWSRDFATSTDVEKSMGGTRAVAHARLGRYLEAGTRGGLDGDRFGCLIPFAREVLGKPCLMTFTWPDDKPRAFGLYMFKETPDRKAKYHRDRLQGGILAGAPYKTTGQMQRTEFLFYPSDTNHWFEARTFIDGEPAALAKVEVALLETPWPRLKVHLPEGLPGRRFGATDEDQTFDHNFNTDWLQRNPRAVTATLLDYFDYTGQNTFHYALARYGNTLGAQVGYDSNGMYPYGTAASSQVVREMTAAGIDYIGEVYFNALPETVHARQIEGDRAAWIMRDREGSAREINGVTGYANFSRADVTEAYLNHYMDEVGRLARNGMKGLRHWLVGSRAFGSWASSDVGYDDWNFAQFRADTGFTDKRLPEVAATAEDYRRRYETLNAPKNVDRWRAWRAEKVTRFVSRMAARVDAVAPGLPLYLEFGFTAAAPDVLYRENGVDLAALAKIPNVRLCVSHLVTGQHWQEFRRFAKKTGPKSRDWSAYFSLTNALPMAIRRLQGAVPLCTLHNQYFETFRDSLGGDRFGSYFQSMDPKPWGRNFLRELAWAVASGDALAIVAGDQPIGTLGNEDEAREFARAYRALPALPFKDLSLGPSAPSDVVARKADTKNGVYYYIVNLSAEDRMASLPEKTLTDLSSDETVAGKGLALRPYELRSFLRRREPAEGLTEPIRVGTYNIRYMWGDGKTENDWEKRKADLVELVKKMDLDVFGMQEVCPRQARYLREMLPEYGFVGDHRGEDRRSGEASPVFYRRDRFDAEDSGTFWLSETPEVPASKSWGTCITRVCSYLTLCDRRSGRRFHFANTHTDHISELARERGLQLILDRMRGLGDGLPLILTGDHNCTEIEKAAHGVSKTLRNALYVSESPPQGPWRTWNDWRWKTQEVETSEALKYPVDVRNIPNNDIGNVSKAMSSGTATPAQRFYERCAGPRIDYIYVSDGVRVLDYETVAAARPGCKTYPSDHFPVVATIRLMDEIVLEGRYPGHLQDVWMTGDSIWWAHTGFLLKTDRAGRILKKAEVGGHHAGLELKDGRIYSAVCAFNGEPRGQTTPQCHVMVGEYEAETLKRVKMHVLDINDRAGSLCFLADGTLLVGCLRHPALKPTEVKFHHVGRDYRLMQTHVVDVGKAVPMGIEVIRRFGDSLYLFIYKGPVVKLSAKTFAVEGRYEDFGGQCGFAVEGDAAWIGETTAGTDGLWRSRLVRKPLVWKPVKTAAD